MTFADQRRDLRAAPREDAGAVRLVVFRFM
jgi:hypothetical protein